jgi:hypothetical protein
MSTCFRHGLTSPRTLLQADEPVPGCAEQVRFDEKASGTKRVCDGEWPNPESINALLILHVPSPGAANYIVDI